MLDADRLVIVLQEVRASMDIQCQDHPTTCIGCGAHSFLISRCPVCGDKRMRLMPPQTHRSGSAARMVLKANLGAQQPNPHQWSADLLGLPPQTTIFQISARYYSEVTEPRPEALPELRRLQANVRLQQPKAIDSKLSRVLQDHITCLSQRLTTRVSP